MKETGMRDINGREILEGDVVQFSDYLGHGPWHRGTGVVTYGQFKTTGNGQDYGNETVLGWYLDGARLNLYCRKPADESTDDISLANWMEILVLTEDTK